MKLSAETIAEARRLGLVLVREAGDASFDPQFAVYSATLPVAQRDYKTSLGGLQYSPYAHPKPWTANVWLEGQNAMVHGAERPTAKAAFLDFVRLARQYEVLP